MHRYHRETSDQLHTQRIEGVAAYVAAISITGAYIWSHDPRRLFRIPFLFLLSLATALVLLFQSYWTYYAFNENGWAIEYQNEYHQLSDRIAEKKPFQSPFGPGTTWRKRKALEIEEKWVECPAESDKDRLPRYCSSSHDLVVIVLHPKQKNMWTFAILMFWATSMVTFALAPKDTQQPSNRRSLTKS